MTTQAPPDPQHPAEQSIEAALLHLAGLDLDHASQRNDIGFNGRDTTYGHSLAQQVQAGRRLTPRQLTSARKMLTTYARTQLAPAGITLPSQDELADLIAIREREYADQQALSKPQEPSVGTVDLSVDQHSLIIRFTYERNQAAFQEKLAKMQQLRGIYGGTFRRELKNAWVLPIAAFHALIQTFPTLQVSDDVQTIVTPTITQADVLATQSWLEETSLGDMQPQRTPMARPATYRGRRDR